MTCSKKFRCSQIYANGSKIAATRNQHPYVMILYKRQERQNVRLTDSERLAFVEVVGSGLERPPGVRMIDTVPELETNDAEMVLSACGINGLAQRDCCSCSRTRTSLKSTKDFPIILRNTLL